MKNENIKINIEIDEYDLSMLLLTLEQRCEQIDEMLNDEENDIDDVDKENFKYEAESLNNTFNMLAAIYAENFEA